MKETGSFIIWGGVWNMQMEVEGHLSQGENRGAVANVQEKTMSFIVTFVNCWL